MICHNKQYERAFIRLMTKLGIDCHRVAGSGSASEAVCDCILFFNNKTYLVEIKATKENKLYFRSVMKEQLCKMIEVCDRNNLVPLLAVKFKRRGWNLIEIKNFKNLEFDKGAIVNENSRKDSIIA